MPGRLLLLTLLWLLPSMACHAGEESPVLLELFTSQGCSSCPPADRLLSEIGRQSGVVALAFHVDYWNRHGWADPFSRAELTGRQVAYHRRFELDGVYTPQAVLNGRTQFIGSDRNRMERELAIARDEELPLRLGLSAESTGPKRVGVRVTWTAEDPLRVDRASVAVAVRESSLVTLIRRGENANLSATNDFVVRSLQVTGPLPLDELPHPLEVSQALGDDWSPNSLDVVVYVQDDETGRLLGLARTPIRW